MDRAWVLILIVLGISIFYQVIKMAVRNGILDAHSELTKRLAAEEKKSKDEVEQ